jgi:2-(1,2-epoxy-1,2-dihydrophenyl)acetyl-CoA isomerase
MEESMNLARHLATQPTRGLARIKKLLNQSFDHTLAEQLELEKEAMRELGRTRDYREGVNAFMEKRKPEFTGE